ncbi:hypothetical protein N0V83_006977 [Neocucurbitaria cava]|uniref:Uncharacterized protein n=1 Tax=Neocucurbitaria cava TaxID=798079 RepID=A0A9W9CKQ4_9PLEO|nr:hypothetical protein N0V83_006977 [Neocucurbitaria cava]
MFYARPEPPSPWDLVMMNLGSLRRKAAGGYVDARTRDLGKEPETSIEEKNVKTADEVVEKDFVKEM